MVNLIIIEGRLVRDPEMRYSANGTPVLNFSIAHNQAFKKDHPPLFLDCAAFGKTAEIMAKHFTKGKAVIVEGNLTMDTWVSKEGQKRQQIKMTVNKFHFVGFAGEKKDAPADSGPVDHAGPPESADPDYVPDGAE